MCVFKEGVAAVAAAQRFEQLRAHNNNNQRNTTLMQMGKVLVRACAQFPAAHSGAADGTPGISRRFDLALA